MYGQAARLVGVELLKFFWVTGLLTEIRVQRRTIPAALAVS